ncbi:MAG: hypothetical protein FWD26_00360 [Treponema sp.]|nr:hypothetical protein [Treponema sp.]
MDKFLKLAQEIKSFTSVKRSSNEYNKFVTNIFRQVLNRDLFDPVWELLEYLEKETDFFIAPASTKYHSSEENGLIRHSLLVTANGINLAPAMLGGDVDMYYLIVSCLFHDFCKVNMYEIKLRNAKNEESGVWEKVPFYKVRDDYLSYGHGIESILRLNKYIAIPEPWNHAIRWHMGAYDMSQMDKHSHEKALVAYREVLFLHTADMLAGFADET